jgi:hypothetical protein
MAVLVRLLSCVPTPQGGLLRLEFDNKRCAGLMGDAGRTHEQQEWTAAQTCGN